jgi:hypothetical protein
MADAALGRASDHGPHRRFPLSHDASDEARPASHPVKGEFRSNGLRPVPGGLGCRATVVSGRHGWDTRAGVRSVQRLLSEPERPVPKTQRGPLRP